LKDQKKHKKQSIIAFFAKKTTSTLCIKCYWRWSWV